MSETTPGSLGVASTRTEEETNGSDRTVKLVSSEGDVFVVPLHIALQCHFIEEKYEEHHGSSRSDITIPLSTISSRALKKTIEYLFYQDHVSKCSPGDTLPEFVIPDDLLIDVALAASVLDV